MPIIKDFDKHSSILDWKLFTAVWEGLSDFWKFVIDKSLITSFHKAWSLLSSPLLNLVNLHKHDFSWDNDDSYLFDNNDPVYIELTFDSSSATGNPNEYYVSSEFRRIIKLQDFIQEPEIELHSYDDDFVYTTGVTLKDRGIIRFTADNYATSMWASVYKTKRVEELVGRFGVFVRYTSMAREEEETIKAIKALAHTRQFGPVIPYMESGICAIMDWPYCDCDGTVVGMDGNSAIYILSSERGVIVIPNNTGLDFSHRTSGGTWTPLLAGDPVLAYEPLIEAVACDDRYSSPNWWIHQNVGELESWHTFYVRFNAELPIDTTTNTYGIDFSAGPPPSEIWQYIKDNKKIGSKPFFKITWTWIPTGGLEETSWDHPGDTSNGIIETSYTTIGDPTGDLFYTDMGLTPLIPDGDIWSSSGFEDVLATYGDLWYTNWSVEVLGPYSMSYGTSLIDPLAGTGDVWGSSWVDTSGGS